MTTPPDTAATDVATSTSPRARIPGVVYLLGAVAFLIGTTELIIAGLLPDIAGSLGVSQSQAGLLVTVFAVGMIVGAPAMAIATLRMPPRATLVAALVVFAAAHFAAALSDQFSVQLIARFVAGVATGTFWAVGAVLAAAAAGAHAAARATSLMVGGLTLANVLGVPIGTFIGQWLGWRAPFWALAILSILTAAVLAALLPRTGRGTPPSVRAEFAPLRQGRLWLIYLACALIPGAFLAAYAYISPMLAERAGLSETAVPLVMLGYGIATVIGTAIGGRFGDTRPFRTAIPAVALITLILATLALAGSHPVVAVAMFLLLGLVALVAQPIMIGQVFRIAGDAQTLSVALSTSALNVGIAGGSALGGIALASQLGTAGPAWAGAAVGVAAIVVVVVLASVTTRAANPKH